MNILHISVINKVATYQQRDGAIVCGNSDYQIEFTFDDEWNASAYKTARFVYTRGSEIIHQDVDFTGNTVNVPVLVKTTEVFVGVYAGGLRTSTPAVIPCKLSILCDSAKTSEPTSDVYQEILARVGKALEIAQNANIVVKEEVEEVANACIVSELAKRAQIKPEFANSIEECSDTTKLYVLPDGYIYANMLSVVEGESAPFGASDFASFTTATASAKTAYGFLKTGATIEGKLKSIKANISTGNTTMTIAVAHMNGSVIESIDEFTITSKSGEHTYLNGDEFNYSGRIKVGDLIGFRMDSYPKMYYGTASNPANVILITTSLTDFTYVEKTYGYAISAVVEGEPSIVRSWDNTGHAFVPADYEPRIIKMENDLADIVAETDVNIKTFNLSNSSVKSFMEGADYNDSDYSYTNVSSNAIDESYRKDLPLPILIGWKHYNNAVEYAVSIGDQTIYTEHNRLAIYNLIPNKTYQYKVQALCADGTNTLVEDGSISTENGTRMLNIDGIQNVRDIGGYSALNGKVKYGLIFRGSAMDEWIAEDRYISENGKKELIKNIGVRTDLDLRGDPNASALGSGIYFRSVAYQPYTTAITDATQRGYFKTMLEYIVERLTNNQSIYIHCSGGCDRTGTLVFLLLGLLGVSESDLAKEYELSSFSVVGKFRTRNSTSYDYSGMVTALKTYGGTTITDKFEAFATECGVTSATINSFRALMLE